MDANVDKVLEFVAANVGRDRAALRAEVEVDPISRLRRACEDYERYAERVLDGLRRVADVDYDRIEGEVKSAPVRPKRIVRPTEVAIERPAGGGQARFVASQPGAIARLWRLERREAQEEAESDSETESDSIDHGGEDQGEAGDLWEDQRDLGEQETRGDGQEVREEEVEQEKEPLQGEAEREREPVREEEVEQETGGDGKEVREEEVEQEREPMQGEAEREREPVREEEVEEEVASSDLDDDNLTKVLPQSGFVAVGQKEPVGITGVSENQYQRFNTITRFPM